MKQETYNLWALILASLTLILAVPTLIALIWYTWKTHQMQQAVSKQAEELVRQTKLSITPAFTLTVVTPVTPRFLLTNIGNGIAINIEVEKIVFSSSNTSDSSEADYFYYFDQISLLRPNENYTLIQHLYLPSFADHQPPFADQVAHTLKSLWSNDKNKFYDVVIRFQDLEGNKHSQHILVGLKSSTPSPVKSLNS